MVHPVERHIPSRPYSAPTALRRSALTALALLPLLATSATAAIVRPFGTEFQVNTYTTASQYQYGPAICHDGAGNFVIVWQSGYEISGTEYGHQDGQAGGIFGQRYDSSGAPSGTEFQVNTYTTGNQIDPAVCCAANGNFVVVWASLGQDGDGYGVFGQRFASSGAFAGSEFQVNTETLSSQYDPALCCDATGDFIVTWESAAQDGDLLGIFAQRFRDTGAPRGTEFQVNTYTTSYQFAPGICCDTTGDFVIVWTSFAPQDGDGSGVFAQRYASNGSPRGAEFQVNTYTDGYQGAAYKFENTPICCDAAGDFTVAWASRPAPMAPSDVFGQRFSSAGADLGTEFQINTYTSGYQDFPSICCGPSGGFVVVWASYVEDGDSEGVFGQRFSTIGAPAGREFQVNTYTTGLQTVPVVSCDATGDFVVSWTSFPNQDGDRSGVFAQAFQQLAIASTPALSLAGLVAGVLVLCAAAARGLRRR